MAYLDLENKQNKSDRDAGFGIYTCIGVAFRNVKVIDVWHNE